MDLLGGWHPPEPCSSHNKVVVYSEAGMSLNHMWIMGSKPICLPRGSVTRSSTGFCEEMCRDPSVFLMSSVVNLSTGGTGEGFAFTFRVHRTAWLLLLVAGPQATPTISPFESMPAAYAPAKPGGREAYKSSRLPAAPR